MQIREYTPTSHKVKALLYGASGSGKTSFAGTAQDALFLSAEGGLLSIADKRVSYVDIHSFRDLEEALSYLQKNPTKFKTVIIDSISEINDIIMSEIERRTGRKMQIQDYGELAQKMKSILRRFRDLDMHVLFLGLEKIITDDDGKVIKIAPELSGKASTGVVGFMDIVGYIAVDKTGERSILTSSHPIYSTKDRSGKIGNDTPRDFEKWIERAQAIETGEQKVVYSDSVTAAQVARIADLWQEYLILKELEEAKLPALISATLKRDFKKQAVGDLTFDEAAKHIGFLEPAVNELKAAKMKEEEVKEELPTINYGAGGKSPDELEAELAGAPAANPQTEPEPAPEAESAPDAASESEPAANPQTE